MTLSALLEVHNLHVRFPVRRRIFGRTKTWVRAVNGVSFAVAPGETLGVVGESGCGKTTLGRAMLRLVEPASGTVWFEQHDITRLTGEKLRQLRRKLQMVFQDPCGSLDPRMTVEQIVGEPLDIHHLAPTSRLRRARISELLMAVGLDASHASRFPHEFSGGQRQRIGIARALAVEPKLIVCDEPVSALDVSVQAQVINLLHDLQRTQGLAYLFISHDLAVVEHICHRILVMYLGQIMEIGQARTLCAQPLHPYTKALISAVPVVNPAFRSKRIVLSGDVPSPLNPPSGCPFHPRCPIAEARCKVEIPQLRRLADHRFVACHLATAS